MMLQKDIISGSVLLVFGCIFFPLLMRFAIEKCEKEERGNLKEMIAVTLVSLPALFLFLNTLNMTEDHILLFMLFAFSLIAILTAKNLLKFLFIFDVTENSLILTAYSFISANISGSISSVVFIEMTTFLPFVLLTYLTVQLFKKYRSLNPWHLWQSL
jgi:hypothetical protein